MQDLGHGVITSVLYSWKNIFPVPAGTESSSPLLGGWCGAGIPDRGSIISTGPVVYVRFYSDASVQGLGFKLVYYSTRSGEFLAALLLRAEPPI